MQKEACKLADNSRVPETQYKYDTVPEVSSRLQLK